MSVELCEDQLLCIGRETVHIIGDVCTVHVRNCQVQCAHTVMQVSFSVEFHTSGPKALQHKPE